MKLVGYVIVRGQEPDIEVFESFRVVSSPSRGAKVAWGRPFLGRGIERFALYKSPLEAEETRQQAALIVDSRVEPLWIGDLTNRSRAMWEELVEDGAWNLTENIREPDVDELLETGSLTLVKDGKTYVLSIQVEQAT